MRGSKPALAIENGHCKETARRDAQTSVLNSLMEADYK